MKHARILPMDAKDPPRAPAPIVPLHLKVFADGLEQLVNRMIWFVIAPGALWVAYQVYVGLRAKGILP